MSKLKSCLAIMRFPNTFTAMADVLAGYLIVRGSAVVWGELIGLITATMCIYAAACVLNDIHDLDIDKQDHPDRPLPSGRITLSEARMLALSLYVAGLAAAGLAGRLSLAVACVIVVLTLSYDLVTKDTTPWGQLNMGACRAFNLILGMSPFGVPVSYTMIFPLFSLVYVFYLTTLSRYEVGKGIRGKGWKAFAGFHLVFLAVLLLYLGISPANHIVFFMLFALATSYPYAGAFFSEETASVARTVKYLIIGIPLLDAVYVSSVQGAAYGIPVALCFVPSILLSRFFYVT